jgi:CheY-like chemotaxis protein
MDILGRDQVINVLFSDVVMPEGMSGIELAQRATQLRQDLRVLLTSGYAPDTIAEHGANSEFPILHKPYRRPELAERIRSILSDAVDGRRSA